MISPILWLQTVPCLFDFSSNPLSNWSENRSISSNMHDTVIRENGITFWGSITATAFVLITTATGKESHVLQEMRKLPELSEVHQLFGQFDLIAKIESKDYDVLCDIVLDKIRTIEGVTSTKTLITARFKR